MATVKTSATKDAAATTTPAATTTSAAATTPAASTTTGATTPATIEGAKKVIVINSKSQFDIKVAEAGNKLVVVEFYAQWCGPCKIIGTKLEELAGKYEGQAMMIKLDVDDCEEVAIEYNVTSMPTFVFLQNKKKINHLIGSNGEKLIESVEKFCTELGIKPKDSISTATVPTEARVSTTAAIKPSKTVATAKTETKK